MKTRLEKRITRLVNEERGIKAELERLIETRDFYSRKAVALRGLYYDDVVNGKAVAYRCAVRAVRELLTARRRVLRAAKRERPWQ